MKTEISIQEYDRLSNLVRSAWVKLNQAGDTPDSHKSILSLYSALDGILAVDAALHGDSTIDTAVARHHHSFLKSQANAPEVLRALSARAQEIQLHPKAPKENVSDALLAHSAIPVIWRLVCGVRRDVRSLRAFPNWARLNRRKAKTGLTLLVAASLLVLLARFALPWGSRVTYYASGEMLSVRGWGVATSLLADYGTGRPLPWMRRDGWAARWQGKLRVPENADYSFFAQCQGGLRLWIDGELLIDNWQSAGWTQGAQHAQRTLQAGPHALRMEFRDCGGNSVLRVRWAGGSIPPNTVMGFPYLRKY
jgi:hypothetical protein